MKKSSWHWLILAVSLIATGLGLTYYKAQWLGYPLTPNEEASTWTIQARIVIEPEGGPVKLSLDLPHDVAGFGRLEESFVSKGFGHTVNETDTRRVAEWTIRRLPEARTVYYRGVFYADDRSNGPTDHPPFPEPPALEEPYASALGVIVDDIRATSADVESFALRAIERLADESPDENTALFINLIEDSRSRVRIAQQILAAARIPAEMVHGVPLEDQRRRARAKLLLAVHNGQRWLYFDPDDGSRGVPPNMFLWWRGDQSVANAEGAQISDLRLSVARNAMDSRALAAERAKDAGSVFSKISLLNLPLESQAVYAVLLMVPLGALIIVVLRNIIGVRTFGTFMPVLIAMAFRETRLVQGLVLFAVVISVGLAIRFYLEHLRLLLVPRLAAVLTIVVLLMATISLVSHSAGFEVGLSVSLFPMVILAMTIERMSVVWEERGPGEAIRDSLGSLAVAALAFLVMEIDLIQHLTFVFPELMLLALGVIIMLGRYTGYRLSELGRFRGVVDFSGSKRHGPV